MVGPSESLPRESLWIDLKHQEDKQHHMGTMTIWKTNINQIKIVI